MESPPEINPALPPAAPTTMSVQQSTLVLLDIEFKK